MTDKITVKRALLSVSDKSELRPLAEALVSKKVELIASGGTAKMLKDWKLPVTPIESFTGNPEAFDGRMKTLSFRLESALLYDRHNPKHVAEAKTLGIDPIDLVVCNFYPFEEAVAKKAPFQELIDEVDIGGPTMVRASAKNHGSVVVLTSPNQYVGFLNEFEKNSGAIGYDFRKKCMVDAFQHVLQYDAAIYEAFSSLTKEVNGTHLRYGENPHQKAVFVKEAKGGAVLWEAIDGAGIELSYNNILDGEAAFGTARDLYRFRSDLCGVVIVKHQNPCGIALEKDPVTALKNAWDGDPVSSFGGIVALTKKLTLEMAKFFDSSRFIEVIMAPGFDRDAIDHLKTTKKNLRMIEIVSFDMPKPPVVVRVEGGLLQQDADEGIDSEFQSVTDIKFPEKDVKAAQFGTICGKWIKSNAIALVRITTTSGYQMIGMGSGQPNRVDAIRKLAVPKAKWVLGLRGENVEEVLADAILVSDAFFPFPDNIDETSGAGIRKIVQPGGSKKDADVIAACNSKKVAMVFTGRRHFRH